MHRSLTIPFIFVLGCTGYVGDASDGPGRPAIVPPAEFACAGSFVPVVQTPHLTRSQYDNTIRDLLGADRSNADIFPGDVVIEGFEVGSNISPAHVDRYLAAAEMLAEEASADLDALLPCVVDARVASFDFDAEAHELADICAAEFFDDFLFQAHRRPLTEEQRAAYQTLFDETKSEQGFREAVQVVIHAALASPMFIYKYEPISDEDAGTVIRLDSYAMASRLSYLFWNSMPDEILFEAATDGELETDEELAAQARRLLNHPNARVGVRNFYRQWLELDRVSLAEKSSDLFPNYTAETAEALRRSLEMQIDQVLWERGGHVDSLLLSDTMFVNEDIAAIIGLPSNMPELSDGGLHEMSTIGLERAGLLTHPGFLAATAHSNQSSPVLRGLFIREQLLCDKLPLPPADIIFNLSDPEEGVSTRERFERHRNDPSCSGCHVLIDPLGVGLEAFDAIGQFRLEDEGVTVDSAGEIVGSDVDGEFVGAQELSEQLSESEEVRECVATQIFRYALGRTEVDLEGCIQEDLFAQAAENGWSIPEIMVAMTQSDSFRFLQVPERTAP